MNKQLLSPERLRRIPPRFSWVDHRLVRDHYFSKCDPAAWTLYLFLVCVADAQGLSYYSDASLSRLLAMDPLVLADARRQLQSASLIAWRKPLCQVLDLGPAEPPRSGPVSLGELMRRAMGGAA